jgi:hypothetical protein
MVVLKKKKMTMMESFWRALMKSKFIWRQADSLEPNSRSGLTTKQTNKKKWDEAKFLLLIQKNSNTL